MSFSIENFKAVIGQYGTARQSHFDVHVFPPANISQGNANLDGLSFRCQAVSLPGRALQTIDHRTYGPIQKIPYDSLFTDVAATFILSEDYDEKLLFEEWQDLAVGKYRNEAGYNATMFDVGYYSDFIGTVDINRYDEAGSLTYVCTLNEAYPIMVSDINNSWDGGNELQTVDVTFAYRTFRDRRS